MVLAEDSEQAFPLICAYSSAQGFRISRFGIAVHLLLAGTDGPILTKYKGARPATCQQARNEPANETGASRVLRKWRGKQCGAANEQPW